LHFPQVAKADERRSLKKHKTAALKNVAAFDFRNKFVNFAVD